MRAIDQAFLQWSPNKPIMVKLLTRDAQSDLGRVSIRGSAVLNRSCDAVTFVPCWRDVHVNCLVMFFGMVSVVAVVCG
jgi:hypothetical protein